MDELAQVSGVSRPTLSKYFNDPTSVRDSSRARIERALEKYDYRLNIFAINQNRRSTKTIGIVVPYLADPFFAEIVRRIEQRCLDAGLRPSLFSAHGQPDLEVEILDNLRTLRPAVVLLAPLGRASNRREIERFCADVPTILFDSNIEGLGDAFVGSDNFNFVQQSVEYLVSTGEPPLFVEMAHPANPNANKRREAYVSVMEALGLEPHVLKVEGEGWDFERIGHAAANQLIERHGLTMRTVLCSNDRLAIGFLAGCYENGLRVGKGEGCALRVAAHDDHPYSRFTCPSLTTVAHDYKVVSEKAVELLFDLIARDGKFETRREWLYPAHLVPRASA